MNQQRPQHVSSHSLEGQRGSSAAGHTGQETGRKREVFIVREGHAREGGGGEGQRGGRRQDRRRERTERDWRVGEGGEERRKGGVGGGGGREGGGVGAGGEGEEGGRREGGQRGKREGVDGAGRGRGGRSGGRRTRRERGGEGGGAEGEKNKESLNADACSDHSKQKATGQDRSHAQTFKNKEDLEQEGMERGGKELEGARVSESFKKGYGEYHGRKQL